MTIKKHYTIVTWHLCNDQVKSLGIHLLCIGNIFEKLGTTNRNILFLKILIDFNINY